MAAMATLVGGYSTVAFAGRLGQPLEERIISKGIYLNGNIGMSRAKLDFVVGTAAEYSAGFNGNVGYQFNSYLALEAGFTEYMFKEVDVAAADVAIKLMFPFRDDFRLFAKAGGSYLFSPVKKIGSQYDIGWLPYLGIGMGYSVTKHVEVTIQAVGATILLADLGLLSAGVTYHF